MVEDVASVKQKGWLGHGSVDLLKVVGFKLIPLGEDGESVGALTGRVGIRRGDQHAIQLGDSRVVHLESVVHLQKHAFPGHLGVPNVQDSLLLEQISADKSRGSLTDVTSVLLECKAEDGDLLPRDCVEHAAHHGLAEPALLVLIHHHHLVPVISHFLEAEGLTDVDEVQDVLLEARAAKPHRGVQELWTNAVVEGEGVLDLVDISVCCLAEGRDGVDGRHALGQEGVRHQLGDLRGPQVRRQDALTGNPVGIDGDEGFNRLQALGVLHATNEHTAWLLQVVHGGALRKELGVRQDLELEALVIVQKDTGHGICGAHRHRGLLHHNLVRACHFSDLARSQLAILDVRGSASANAVLLSWGVHRNEDDVCQVDLLIQVCGEEEVLASGALDDLI
mmetsp:Transcript_21895/g.63710  ORF Transcript_21895/g.63710 Transcript_21895/m.63710 type:complete len:393 (-) Transcript_21895:249-1427(-)